MVVDITSEAVATLVAAIIGVLGAIAGSSFGTRKRILDNIKILNSFDSEEFTNKQLLEKEINRDIGKSIVKEWQLTLYIIAGILSVLVILSANFLPYEFISKIISVTENQWILIKVTLTCVLWFVLTWCIAGFIRWWQR